IETDKATMEVEAVDEGTGAKLVVPAGTEGVKVNALIAVLAAEGEDAGAAAKSGGGAAPAKAETPKAEAPKADAPKAETPKAEPVATASKADAAPVANGHAAGERTFASPLARRIAKEAGVDVSAVTGTGPHGRVVKADVDAAIAGGGAQAAPAAKAPAGAPAPAVKAMSDDQILKLFEQGSYDLVPHDNMRKTIARRLVEAKTTIPHFYLTLDCELDALLALRTQINAAAPVKKTDK
ncbi:E3 binding domain-containing protein, partial [Mesorhizobium sp. M7A.F.Ca.CA.004.02.1.1]|uniref:E3 binding domain-containing protein n=1 Tax=Mesorhizobium sp. M7A.F.Ca.CA.004.02.1.1 TaxID=2496690 RepID=UPI000FD56974